MQTVQRWPALILLLATTTIAVAERLPDVPGLEQDAALRAGLANSRIKFERDQTGVVVYIGGSITQATGWSQQVDADLKRRFPQTQFTFVHAGISSVDSSGHSFRLQRDALEKGVPDLVFVEAAVNDLHNGRSATESRRAMEGIVRRLRRANRFVDVVFLHFAEPRHTADYEADRVPAVIAVHEAVAEHYRVPSLNLAREVQRRMRAGQFDWSRDFKDLHPSPFGHELYGHSVGRLFDLAWNLKEPLGDAKQQEHAVPPPVDSACYDAGLLVSPERTEAHTGFRLDPKWRPAAGQGTRAGFVDVPMFVGERPNDGFAFRFEGRAVGFFLTAGPDTGVIEYRIDDGPWKERDTFTQWSRQLHLPWVLMLETELPSAPHRLEVRLSEKKNPAGTGTALRIRCILVNGPTLDLPKLSERQIRSTLDGTDQPSLVWAPESARNSPTPLLVYLHSWSGDYRQDNSAWQREAVRRGWIYLHPNFRGINQQPQACGSESARQDVIDAIDAVSKEFQIDKQRVYLAGTSGGGHMAMLLAAYFPRRFSGVSAWVGINDLADWYRFHAKNGPPDHYARMTAQALGGPPEDAAPSVAAEYRARSPLFHVQRAVGVPLDIAAGVNDGHTGSVPIAHSLRAFNVLARASHAPLVSDSEIDELSNQRKLSAPTATDTVTDASYGRAILLRRQAGSARVTIFDGGHEGLPTAACDWLAKQSRPTE